MIFDLSIYYHLRNKKRLSTSYFQWLYFQIINAAIEYYNANGIIMLCL